MEEQVKNEVVEETEKTEKPEKEEKAETKETKKAEKAKKAEKPSLAKRAKSAVSRNKKPIIAGIGGFLAGVGSAFGASMWLGHRQRKAEEMAARNIPVTPQEDYSPLDPNVE